MNPSHPSLKSLYKHDVFPLKKDHSGSRRKYEFETDDLKNMENKETAAPIQIIELEFTEGYSYSYMIDERMLNR